MTYIYACLHDQTKHGLFFSSPLHEFTCLLGCAKFEGLFSLAGVVILLSLHLPCIRVSSRSEDAFFRIREIHQRPAILLTGLGITYIRHVSGLSGYVWMVWFGSP
ncbi:hypothetical protein HDV57DRAFT_175314 [Trichoderma longibrachiatum]